MFNLEFVRVGYTQGQYYRTCVLKSDDLTGDTNRDTWKYIKVANVPDVEFVISNRIKKIKEKFNYSKVDDTFTLNDITYAGSKNYCISRILQIIEENPKKIPILKLMEIYFNIGQLCAIFHHWPETAIPIKEAFEECGMRDVSSYVVVPLIF
jgi:hypothetical protein